MTEVWKLQAHDGMLFSFGWFPTALKHRSHRQGNKRIPMADQEMHTTDIKLLSRARENKCCQEL